MQQGYAIVASDYVGLGTPGLHAYLNGFSEAHSIVDMVKAGRAFVSDRLPADEQFSNEWVVVGQSQGGGAAIYTARYASHYGGRRLDYRGGVGTGVPAYVERIISTLGPKVPPVALPPALTEYLAYIFAGLRYVHPELGIDGILTDSGRKYLNLAETECGLDFEKQLKGVNPGDWFTKPVASLPNFEATARDYMGMPEQGFDRPFFIGSGLIDTDVPYALTVSYATALMANHQPLTFKTYPYDHSGTLVASQKDTIPFVRGLFAH
jgi:hypothetical protein